MITLALLASASAEVPHQHAVPGDKAALWEAYVEHFEAPDAVNERWGCATGVVMDLKQRWSEFTPEEQARIEAHVPMLRPKVVDRPELPENTPMLPATDTCWGQQGANRVVSEHFSVEWDGTTVTTTTAENFAAALEYSWGKLFDELGWNEPDNTERYLIMAYIEDSNYGGAYTTVEYCGGMYTPYIVAGKGSFGGGTWYQDMAGHELNHASQFSYGYGHEFWFWEATATYVEEDIYSSHNGWSDYITGYTANPWLSMNSSDQNDQEIFWHMYGMAIWLFYMDEHHAGDTFGQEAWEYAISNGRMYDINMEEMIEDLGYDWAEVYEGFVLNNVVMDFAEHSSFPDVDLDDEVTVMPADGGSSELQGYGQHYVWFDTDEADDDAADLEVKFFGEDAEWLVALVGVEDGEIVTIARAELDGGRGPVTLSDWGQYDDVYLAVSPMEWSDSSFSYDWEAEGVAPPEPEPDTDVADTDVGDIDLGDDVGLMAGGCGCDGSSSASFAWLALAVLPLLRRRR
jgi:uncharacterized protein (TIGR03382 family)